MRLLRIASVAALASALIVGFQNCGGSHSGDSSDTSQGGPTGDGVQVFQSGLYAFFHSQNCVMCHGNGTGPQFAVADVNAAYAVAKSFLNLSDPAASQFVGYATNNHCGNSVCNPASGAAAITAQVTSLVEAWAAAENGSGTTTTGQAKYTTSTEAMPATIPTIQSGTTATMTFSLASLGVPSLSNATFNVSIQMINPTEYRVSSPIISGNTAAVNVTGIHVYLRPATTLTGVGAEDPNQGIGWDSLIVTVPSNNTGSIATTTIDIQQQSVPPAVDSLTIGFDKLQ